MNYVILFSLESLIGADGEPDPAAATIYNMVATQARVLGHAIREAKLEDATPFVDIFTDKPESDRIKIMDWLRTNDIDAPRKLRLGLDPIGDDRVLAVFDNVPERIAIWRGAGAMCFEGNVVQKIVLQS